MYWYVLFVETGQEQNTKIILEKYFNFDILIPFVPMLETTFKRRGQLKRELKPLFPGYMFIKTNLFGVEFEKVKNVILSVSKHIFRFLKYANTSDYAMREDEKWVILNMSNQNYCIESSAGVIEDGVARITYGPLMGLETRIKKIDRHKRRVWIDIEFMGSIRAISLSCEFEKF